MKSLKKPVRLIQGWQSVLQPDRRRNVGRRPTTPLRSLRWLRQHFIADVRINDVNMGRHTGEFTADLRHDRFSIAAKPAPDKHHGRDIDLANLPRFNEFPGLQRDPSISRTLSGRSPGLLSEFGGSLRCQVSGNRSLFGRMSWRFPSWNRVNECSASILSRRVTGLVTTVRKVLLAKTWSPRAGHVWSTSTNFFGAVRTL